MYTNKFVIIKYTYFYVLWKIKQIKWQNCPYSTRSTDHIIVVVGVSRVNMDTVLKCFCIKNTTVMLGDHLMQLRARSAVNSLRARCCDMPHLRLDLANLRVQRNCSRGERAMYPCAATRVIHPPKRLCTSSDTPTLRMWLDPPTLSECPVQHFAHARVISGTHSVSACCSALTTDCAPTWLCLLMRLPLRNGNT